MARSTPKTTFDMGNFLAQVTTSANHRTYKRNQTIFQAGAPAGHVFYLQTGKVKITVISEQGKTAVAGIVLPGQFFGQSSLGGQTIHHATASALDTAVTLISIRRHIFQGLLANDQAFASAFMMDLLEGKERIEADLVDQLFNSSEKRLARVLLTLAHYGNHRQPQPILGKIAHATLAEKIGTTRARVTFFMNRFRKLGFINYNGEIEVMPALLHAVLHEWPDDDMEE